MRHKLHADMAAHAAWDDLMLAAIGLETAAARAAAKTTAYAAQRTFVEGDQSALASPMPERHVGLLTAEQQDALTEDTTPALVALATEAGDDLVDDAGNSLVGWI